MTDIDPQRVPHATPTLAQRVRTAMLTPARRKTLFFLLAGGTAFLIYLALSNAFHYGLGIDETWAALAGAIGAIPPAFLMQKHLTFRSTARTRDALPRYVLLQLFNAAFISATASLGARFGIPGVLVFVLAGGAGTLVSYFVQSRLVFRARPQNPEPGGPDA